MEHTAFGILILVIAGVMNANFTLPMKFTTRWAWENTWLAFSIFALLIMPPVMALLTIPDLGAVYSEAGVASVLLVAACGAGWGIAQVLFGLAVDAIGIALTFSIILGISAAIGSLLPLVQLHPDKIATAGGMGIIAGVVLVIVGVTVCAVAGRKREAALGTGPQGKASFGRGLTFAVVSGFLAAAMNFGVAFGAPIARAAKFAGADPQWTVNAIWLPLMVAGAIPNLLYCVYLLKKNGTTKKFAAGGGSYWLLAILMAFFWFASAIMYGVSSSKLGELGPVLGWPLFMSLIVIVASVVGIVTGEWKGTGKTPVRIQAAGVCILIIAVVVFSRASLYL
jgi:L-rhamnose-H+ transport protein